MNENEETEFIMKTVMPAVSVYPENDNYNELQSVNLYDATTGETETKNIDTGIVAEDIVERMVNGEDVLGEGQATESNNMQR